MKIPKKVLISGQSWKIKKDHSMSGGSFDGATNTITIGTLYPQDIPDILVHEILECILSQRCLRYQMYEAKGNEQYLFSFDHKEFNVVTSDLAIALKDICGNRRSNVKDKASK